MPRHLLELFRLTPARPAIAAGFRAAVAATLPLLVGAALPPTVVSWLSLGAFQSALADRGGAYRSRAMAMLSVATCSSLACTIGSLVGNSLIVSVVVGFCWLFACGLAHVGGAVAAGTGRSAAVAFMVAQAQPVQALGEALGLGAAVACGAALTMSMALLLWPVRLYRPARLAIAACYDRLAAQARLLATAPGIEDAEAARALYAERSALRKAMEDARTVLAATRGGRQAESERGEVLLRILENADQILGVCVAIDGWMQGATPAQRSQMATVLEQLAARASAIGARLAGSERARIERPALPAPASETERLLIARLDRHLGAAVEAANVVYDRRPLTERGPPPIEPPSARPRLGELLRGALDRRSVTLRHALRLAIAGSIAMVALALLGIERGYWATVTLIVVLQPWTNATFDRGLQRMAGTVLGAGIAVLAVQWADDRYGFAAIVFVFCFASVALLPLNYGIFSVLLTPAFVLLAELATGDLGLAWVRMFDTLIGGGTALLAALVLWPRWERQRFPDELARALHCSAAWLREQSLSGGATVAAEQARREAGIGVLNVEASLQRLLSEPGTKAAPTEPLLVLTLYLRRIHATTLAITSAENADPEVGRRAVAGASAFLEKLALAVSAGEPPGGGEEIAALEGLAEKGGEAVGRLVRQLAIVQGAATRGFAGGAFR